MTPSCNSTQFSPYFLLFKREARLPIDVALTKPEPFPQDLCLHKIMEYFEIAQGIVRENLAKVQQKNKTQYDKKTEKPTFALGQ
jgi:hypothetical protein